MIILTDSHEKIPLFQEKIKYLRLGNTKYSQDYSVEGMEHIIGVQYKRLADLYQSVGKNHDNFMKNCEAFKKHVLNPYLVTASLNQILQGCNHWNVIKAKRRHSITTQVKDYQIVGTLVKVAEIGIRIRFVGDSQQCEKWIRELFTKTYQDYQVYLGKK